MQTDSLPRSEGPVQLAIRMRPPWRFIDEIRRFVESFCACAPGCPEHREAQLAVAVHELVQNAVPRAGQGDVELLLDVDPGIDQCRYLNPAPGGPQSPAERSRHA